MDIGQLRGSIGIDTGPLNRDLDRAGGMLKGWGGRAAKLAAGAGALVGGAIGAAIVTGMNLEPATDKLSAQLGLTGKEADKVSKAAGKVFASNWGTSMEDAAARTGAVISSIDGMRDATADTVAEMTGLISAVADTFELDAARIAQVTGQMVKTGMAKDAREGADLLAATLSKVPANVREDILDAVDEYGPFMRQLGMDGASAMTMLADASAKGMYGIDKTGDALKEFTIRSTDMSKSTTAAYAALGLNADEMTKSILAGGEQGSQAFNTIVRALQGMKDPAAQSAAALALFGTPLEDLGTNEIPKFLSGLTNVGNGLGQVDGAAEQMGKTLSDNAAANIETARRQFIMLATDALGGTVIPAITKASTVLSTKLGPGLTAAVDAGKALAGWAQEHSTTLVVLAGAVGGVTLAYAAFTVQQAIAMAGGMGAWILTIIKSTQAWAVAQGALNLVMSLNPIGIVVMAIAALVGAFIAAYTKSERFRTVVNGAFGAVKTVAVALGRWFVTDFIGFFTNAYRSVTGWMSRTRDGITNAITTARNRTIEIATGLRDGVVNRVAAMRDGVVNRVTGLRDGVVNRVAAMRDGVINRVTGLRDGVVNRIASARQSALSHIEQLRSGVLNKLGDLRDSAGRVLNGLTAKITGPIRTALSWVNTHFVGGLNTMLSKAHVPFKIPAIPGFAKGGYTGPGGRFEPAGVVHRGEVVWSQDDVAAHGGPQAVDAMRRYRPNGASVAHVSERAGRIGLPGFADGGIVGKIVDGIGSAAKLAMDPAGTIRAVATKLLGGMPSAGVFGMVASAVLKMIPGAISGKVKDLLTGDDSWGGNLPAGPAGIGGDIKGLNPEFLKRLGAWNRQAQGGKFRVGSGYRSIEEQRRLYNRYKAGVPGQAPAAPPGRSMHNFGLAADLSPSRTSAGQRASGRAYGLYWPMSYEPWHVQPIGMRKPAGYASGTLNATPGLHAVGEAGPELVLGQVNRQFSGGEQVKPVTLGDQIRPEDIREALNGMKIDLDNGTVFFDQNMARHARVTARRERATAGVR